MIRGLRYTVATPSGEINYYCNGRLLAEPFGVCIGAIFTIRSGDTIIDKQVISIDDTVNMLRSLSVETRDELLRRQPQRFLEFSGTEITQALRVFTPLDLDRICGDYSQDSYIVDNIMLRYLIDFLIKTKDKVVKEIKKKTPDYQPFQSGAVVYALSKRNGVVDYERGVGKIMSVHKHVNESGDYVYDVEFVNYGVDSISHARLVPAKDFFDYFLNTKECYRATFNCGGLFLESEPFLLKDGYLYNRGNTVIIKFSNFEKKFKQNDTVH